MKRARKVQPIFCEHAKRHLHKLRISYLRVCAGRPFVNSGMCLHCLCADDISERMKLWRTQLHSKTNAKCLAWPSVGWDRSPQMGLSAMLPAPRKMNFWARDRVVGFLGSFLALCCVLRSRHAPVDPEYVCTDIRSEWSSKIEL